MRMLRRLIGLEAKLAQYEYGERFIAARRAGGRRRALDVVWEGPERCRPWTRSGRPSAGLARVGLAGAAV